MTSCAAEGCRGMYMSVPQFCGAAQGGCASFSREDGLKLWPCVFAVPDLLDRKSVV